MNNTTLSFWIYTAALVLVLLPVTFFSYIKKLSTTPQLTIEMIPSDHYVKKKWITSETDAGNPLWVYEICWQYKLVIRNHSPHGAYYPKLRSNLCLPHYSHLNVLNHYVPIQPNETTEIQGEYVILEKCAEGKHTKPTGLPEALNKTKFLLEYQNEHKFRFYTVFDFKGQTNTTSRSRPSEFA